MSGYPPDGILARVAPSAIVVSTDKLPREYNAVAVYGCCAPVLATRWYGDITVSISTQVCSS